MAGAMIPPEVLNCKSLFSLLYKIDQDLFERTKAKGCPSAGVRCTAPITYESLEVGPLILKRFLKFALACAVVVQVAGVVYCRHRCVFGAAGFTGRLCCCWSVPFVKGEIPLLPWNISRRFAGYGVQPSSAGNATFETFLPRVSNTGAWADI